MNPDKKPIRIAILASTLNIGGAERVVEAIAVGLPPRGFEVDIFCLKEAGVLGEELKKEGVRLREELSKCRIDPFTVLFIAKTLKKGYDVFFSIDHHNACFYGAISSWFSGVKHRVLAVHSTGLWGRGTSFSLTDKMVIPLYSKIIALAESHKDYLLKREHIPEEKIVVIPNGVDTERFSPQGEDERRAVRTSLGIPDDEIVVSIVAALRPEKNHPMFLRAAKDVLLRGDDFTFLVIGDGEEKQALEGLSRNLGIEEKVKFLGLRKDVDKLLGITDISVLCSFPVVETFPISVLEAMSCGVSVVSTNVGSVKEIIKNGENGILIESGDKEALVREILRLSGDGDLRRRMGCNARETVLKKYSLKRMLDRYAELFGSMARS